MKRFGEKLRMLRKTHNVTMKELAVALGISAHSYISKLENGEKDPSVEMAVKVSDFFNVSLDNLLKDDLEIDREAKP
ncbi:MAG: helix-turn-helix transcriptional regulator [Chloroflexi bacterium]|nr:helix-turn-helix transcriptional regulator [Chloroflexota bacterium]MBP8056298.1 helix-turn-helix transcriptional regulator [Chloroflexota bacterium]